MGASFGSGSSSLRSPEPQSVSAHSGDDPSRGRIWSYASALGKALIQLAPKDFCMEWPSKGRSAPFSVSCTIATQHEADAVCEIIQQIAQHCLTSHREAVRGDIFEPEPKPSFHEEMERMFGAVVTFTRDSDRSGEAIETPQSGSTEGESAGPKDIAQ